MRASLVSLRVASMAAATALVTATGCNLDTTNPNAPTQSTVLTTRDGIVRLAVGLQANWGSQMDDFIFPGGLITDDLGARQGALQSYRDAETGVLLNDYDATRLSWNSHYRTVNAANDLIANAPKVGLGDATLNDVLALAYLAKGVALGDLLQQYQRIILDPSQGGPGTYADRAAAVARVRALLDSAAARYSASPPSAEFTSSILAPTIALPSTIYAMQARYARLANDWQSALAAAAKVSPGVVSSMPFSATAPNPIVAGFSAYALPRDTLRLEAEPGDARVQFHEIITGAPIAGALRPLRNFAQYTSAASPIAIYYPGEIQLIRAEAYAQTGQLTQAASEVNAVRTKCAAGAADPQACLPPLPASQLATQAQILAEIYKQRRFELFATGLRWEDARRLQSVGPGLIARRCWLLYPVDQRNADPATPPDPESSPPSQPVSCGI